MIDTDKYEGHTPAPWDELLSVGVEDQEGWDALLELGFNDEARLLIADAPLLLQEVNWLREDINQIPIDLLESLDLILEAHHPEVRESVMAMLGDAIGNNVVGYEE